MDTIAAPPIPTIQRLIGPLFAVTVCLFLSCCSMDAGRHLIVYQKSQIPVSGHLLALHNEQVLLQPKDRLPFRLVHRGSWVSEAASAEWKVIESSVSRIRLEDIDSVRIVGYNHIASESLRGLGAGLIMTLVWYAGSQGETKRTLLSMKGADLDTWLIVGTVLVVSFGLTGLVSGLIRTTYDEMLYPSDTNFRSAMIEVSAFSDDAPEELDRIAPPEIQK